MRLRYHGSLLVALMVAPVPSLAEGAVRHLDCTVTRVCAESGSCNAGTGTVAFSMAPVKTAQDGSGSYEIRYGDKRAPMQALSGSGPFHWKLGDEQNTLLVNSESELLWHVLDLARSPRASIRFLSCRYRQ